MKRRAFIILVGGAAAWPLATRAQQADRIRRIGVLYAVTEDNVEGQARRAAFLQALRELGWSDGRNVRIDYRWGATDAELGHKYAAELLALKPDVILTAGETAVAAMQRATRTVPIVFAQVPDPVGAGLVDTLARPGGNITGFTVFEYGTSVKWVELLKQIAPHITHVVVLRDPAIASGTGQLGAIQASAPSFGVELRPVDVHRTSEIERTLASFASTPNGGLIVTGSTEAVVQRNLIVTLAARHRLPAIYPQRFFVTGGGLISYGPDRADQHRRAAGYVDRILKGEKPSDLPVQAPTKYELVINLKTAKTLGLTVPPALLARADDVIE